MISSKPEILNPKQGQIAKDQNIKKYDLEQRTFLFAKNVIGYVSEIPKTLSNVEVCKQLVRSAGSIGANYIEANEALSKKDFLMRIKISRKEAKESRYWLNLIVSSGLQTEKYHLIQEATELMKIFGSIVSKSS